jgi:hypothetical protein
VFFLPGVALVAAGWLMRRRAGTGGSGGVRRRAAAPMLLAAGTLAAGSLAALPTSGGSAAVTVVFGPGTRDVEVFTAVAAVEGRVVAGDAGSGLWIVDLPPASSRLRLYRHGALVVGGVLLPAGCFSPAAWGRG